MFDNMVNELSMASQWEKQGVTVTLDNYLQWQKEFSFDALRNRRFGQSFCNHFNIQDYRVFYERDWVKCDTMIRSDWICRP